MIPRPRPVPVRWNGRTRGFFDGWTGTYRRRATRAHFCLKHQGWGLQADIVDYLARVRCVWVEVAYSSWTPGGAEVVTVYRARFQDYVDHGVRDTLAIEDGTQVFLSKDHFTPKWG